MPAVLSRQRGCLRGNRAGLEVKRRSRTLRACLCSMLLCSAADDASWLTTRVSQCADPSDANDQCLAVLTDTNNGVRFLLAGRSVIGAQFTQRDTRDQPAFAGFAVMESAKYALPRPSGFNALTLGVGVGVVPRLFRKAGILVDAVEVSASVLEAAQVNRARPRGIRESMIAAAGRRTLLMTGAREQDRRMTRPCASMVEAAARLFSWMQCGAALRLAPEEGFSL